MATVYDVIVGGKTKERKVIGGEIKETIRPIFADLVSLYHIMGKHWLPIMTKKYGKGVILKRREEASPALVKDTNDKIAAAHARCQPGRI